MPVPVAAKGIIIATSILLAAGVALYETNPQLRAWLDNSRRKIALALHNLGNEIDGEGRRRNGEETEGESEELRERRRWFEEGLEAEMRRQGWNGEIFDQRMQGPNGELRRRNRAANLFDGLVREDGRLREEFKEEGQSSRGFERGASAANPFGDEFEVREEKSQMMFDQDLIGAAQDDVLEHEKEAIIGNSRESTATLGRSRESTATVKEEEKQQPLVDISEGPIQPQPRRPAGFFENMLQNLMPTPPTHQQQQSGDDEEFELQMRQAIEASLHDTHGDSSMLDTTEDADLKAAIAASLEDTTPPSPSIPTPDPSHSTSAEREQPLPSLPSTNPWSDLSASHSTSFHSIPNPDTNASSSSFILPAPSTSSNSSSPAAREEMTENSTHPPLSLPISLPLPLPQTHTGTTEELYSLTPPGALTPTSASFITSPSPSRPESPMSEAFSTFSAVTPGSRAASASERQGEYLFPEGDGMISPLGVRSEANDAVSEVSGWSEVDGGSSVMGEWTDVESEAGSEDGREGVEGRGQARL
ncbi:MAG: hypothetical protein M1820_008936 [Bogoriella megaspora]|nr:MAG: hypothetical protein M1820_008936 [Bogoriella megaspora]